MEHLARNPLRDLHFNTAQTQTAQTEKTDFSKAYFKITQEIFEDRVL